MNPQTIVDNSCWIVSPPHLAGAAQVVRGKPLLSGKFQTSGVGVNGRAGQHFDVKMGLQFGSAEQAAQRPDAVDGDLLVLFGCEIVGLDDGRMVGVWGARL